MNRKIALATVKAIHTAIWAFFVACIIGALVAARLGDFALAALLIGFVAVEALVLLLNRWSCPLTGIAARYTERREANFDIYLPRWLARHNKTIFTPLYLLGAAIPRTLGGIRPELTKPRRTEKRSMCASIRRPGAIMNRSLPLLPRPQVLVSYIAAQVTLQGAGERNRRC